MQINAFAWINAKNEKITEDGFENYGVFAQYLLMKVA